MFGAVAFFPLFFGLAVAIHSPGPLVIPTFVFCVGLMRMLYARIFEDAAPEQSVMFQHIVQPVAVPPQPVSFLPSNYQPPLASPQSNAPTTGNLVQPSSVAEPTTSLLKQR